VLVIEPLPSLELPREQHLRVLRRLDRANRWETLADLRRCLSCGEVFCGSEIAIVGGTRAYGPLRLQCPGKRCVAGPESWVPVVLARNITAKPAIAPVMTHAGRAFTVRRNKSAPLPGQSVNSVEPRMLGRWGAAVQTWLSRITPGPLHNHDRRYPQV
jgi:hypothetical protein